MSKASGLSVVLIALLLTPILAQQKPQEQLQQIEQALKDDVPKILCIDPSFATGGQPTEAAFAKLAAKGFRSVLSLRTANEDMDANRERDSVEKAGMRYINIPVVANAPRREQADEFLRVVKDKANQPMLIHCASANRVGAFWMIHRVVDDGWSEEKALEEAIKIGLKSPVLKEFAKEYIAALRAKA
jgi:uncharacterized protein (TIGR01244 family)